MDDGVALPGDVLPEGQVLDGVRHVDEVGVQVMALGVRGDVEGPRNAIDPDAAVDDASAGANLTPQGFGGGGVVSSLAFGGGGVGLAVVVFVSALVPGVRAPHTASAVHSHSHSHVPHVPHSYTRFEPSTPP